MIIPWEILYKRLFLIVILINGEKESFFMIGIYKITNSSNGTVYIGQSVNIEGRFYQHITNAFNSNYSGYDTKFYRSIRKYGKEVFSLSIVEECTKFELNEKERFYIEEFDSWRNGLNSGPGGDIVSSGYGENHGQAKLTKENVLYIKKELSDENGLNQYELSEKFGVNQASISNINRGVRWAGVGNYSYPIRKQPSRTGEKSSRTKITEKEAIDIRNRYVKESGRAIYEDYKERVSYSTLEAVLIGRTYPYLPIYLKKDKKWIYR